MQAGGILKGATRRKFIYDCGGVAVGFSSSWLFDGSHSELAAAPQSNIAPTSSDWRTLTADLEMRLPALLAQAPAVPAVSMALVADAKLLWRGAFGVKDYDSRAPVTHTTIFEAGSVSKTVFAYIVMKLCEKRVLDLDVPLTRYTPDRILKGDPRLDLITARHVLSHTTGFQNWRSTQEPLAIHFAPGERFSYSGEGYSYLQSVVTHLAGHVNPNDCKAFEDGVRVCATDFDAYMKANLLVPFGMRSSGYLYREGMARPYDDKGRLIGDRKATAVDAARYGSAGGLHTTPTEYAKFLIEIMAPKPTDAYRLSTSSLREIFRPQVKVTESMSWGLGWTIEHTKAGDIIAHSGDNPGYKAMVAASMQRKAGFIIMTNGDLGFDQIIAKVVKSEPMQRFLPAILV
jgi:CubicO group peptidase (beta-lactamase class C family)